MPTVASLKPVVPGRPTEHDCRMLEARGIEKSYGDVVALKGADLTVEAGSVVSLLGRNGAGKSTLLSTIAGLLAPDAGEITVDGVDVWRDPKGAARLVGIAPHETGIYRAVRLNGADIATRNQLIAVVRGLANDGAAVVCTTPYLPEVEALDADIVVIDDGQVLARGTQSWLAKLCRRADG
ncbi:MAG: ABC-type multidrug transport system ATPase subunit [Candidatus Poriferisodalaceae bacterium]|jgi:ABC-type multidrug transport system ATPase subunit